MRANKAFTLVELIIVVLILGALASIAIPRIIGGSAAAKTNACATNIDMINTQIELYYQNNGAWPNDLEVVTRDTTYFPDGEPKCPITGQKYTKALTAEHRVDTTGHAPHP
jgi:prepilin-type N-terminal cleavage/methylation domain-containing protein